MTTSDNNLCYLELNKEQKLAADGLLYLLGCKIKDKVFTIRENGQVDAINSTIHPLNLIYEKTACFCLVCRKGFTDIHDLPHSDCNHNEMIAINIANIKNYEDLNSLREQFEFYRTEKMKAQSHAENEDYER